MSATIRPAREGDLPGIVAIYNHYVLTTPITFDVDAQTVSTRAPWFTGFAETGPHRLLVADHGGEIRGYVCSQPHRPRPAYRRSVETSIYLAPDAVGAGLGRRLYEALFTALAEEEVHRLVAGVALPNPASQALHERVGFTKVGVFTEVGWKYGRYWDVVWYERGL
ncbi:MAG: N-acetyltransferase family protein [Alphaproteobacteria bacterium]|nr:N-acetyltransferase family protein [Alphaproteobacteria bacterium]